MSKKKRASTSAKSVVKSQPKSNRGQVAWWIGGAGMLIILVLLGAILLQQPASKTDQQAGILPAEISVADAYQMYQEGAYVLDVRTQEEWDEYHAPGTTLVPLDQLPNRLNEVPKDREIVVVCRSGNRSQQARDILLNAGFEQVTSMAGGLNSWSAAGYPIEGTRP
jgi:rhodanese-related sulfurtransferase